MIRDLLELLSRSLAVVRRGRLDREFEEEIAAHLDLLTEQNVRRGLPRDEARRHAILQIGGLNPTKYLHRDVRGLPRVERVLESIHAIGKDLRHAGRSLVRARAFALVCVLSLGVGMGAFVALVTFMRAMTAPARAIDTHGLVEVLVTPLGPLRAKTGLAAIEEWSYPDFEALRHADVGMTITGWTMGSTEVGVPSPSAADRKHDSVTASRVSTLFVSANYFQTLGASLARGRGFDPALDDRSSAEPRVVVSHGFWRNKLGSDPDVVGKTLVLDGVPHTVVGVAGPEFRGTFNALNDGVASSMIFVPLERHPRLRTDTGARANRTVEWIRVHGRLLPGIDIARASASVSATMADLSRRYPTTNEFKSASVEPYFSAGAANRSQMRRTLALILTLAATVLLIVCVNISGMMLVRGAARERELSIREAVGASRWRLIQYLFFEAVWLALIGGALSVAVLFGIPAGVARWLGTTVPPELALDSTAIAIAAGLCLAVSLVLGLLPAVRMSRPNLLPALKDDAGGGGQQVSRVHRAAAAIQVAIAVPFLVISGAMLDRVRTADFGFETDGLVAARVDPAAASRRRGADLSIRSVRASLAAADGVKSVAISDGMPIDFIERPVRVSQTGGSDFVSAHVTYVAEGYLDTLRVRLVRGRAITAEDRAAAARVVVISEPLAARLFENRDPIGERLTFALEEGRDEEFIVVGVTADFATSQLTTERPQMLLPLPERPGGTLYVIARGASADETRLTSAFENVGRDFNLEFLPSGAGAFRGIVTGRELVEKSLNDVVAESIAFAVAGSLVLGLASLGILGVIAFMVATRTREIAVRIALGATRTRVVRLMLSDVVTLVAPGVVVGLLVGAVLIRTTTTIMDTPLTVGPKPLGAVEPLIYAGAAAIAVVIALIAALPAARRAISIEPMIAMRSE